MKTRRWFCYLFLNISACLGLAFCLGYTAVAQATTITVTNHNDSGPGSLRQAIIDTNSSLGLDTIDFDDSLTGGTITLTSGNLSIIDDLNIIGLGAANLTVSGNNSSNVFRIFDNPSASVQIDGLTISGGRSTSGGAIANTGKLTVTNSTITSNSAYLGGGGGIYNDNGTLTIINSIISSNESEDDSGGGIYSFGGTVSITDSKVSNNIAWSRGGGIFHGTNTFGQTGPLTIVNSIISDNVGGDGGGISNEGVTLSVINSTISGNVGRDGGGIYGGFFGESTITNSAISDNTAASGGGIRGANLSIQNSTISGNTAGGGSGIFALGTFTVTNSTISNNIATGNGASGGGIELGVGASVTVAYSTISGNTADEGGGICNGCTSGTPGTNLNLIGSIVANNNASTGPDLFNDTFGLINLAEANLIGVSADSDIPCESQGNLCDIAALLGPLQNNGGSTETHALLLGSPAIDAGSPPNCPPPDTDQRWYARPVDGDGNGIATCDIGSFEFGAKPPSSSGFIPSILLLLL